MISLQIWSAVSLQSKICFWQEWMPVGLWAFRHFLSVQVCLLIAFCDTIFFMETKYLIERLAKQYESFYLYEEQEIISRINLLKKNFPSVDFLWACRFRWLSHKAHPIFQDSQGPPFHRFRILKADPGLFHKWNSDLSSRQFQSARWKFPQDISIFRFLKYCRRLSCIHGRNYLSVIDKSTYFQKGNMCFCYIKLLSFLETICYNIYEYI